MPSISDEHTSQTIGIYLPMPGTKNGRSRPDTLTGSHERQRIWRRVGDLILWRLALRQDGTLADHTRMVFFRCFRSSHRPDPTKVLGIGQEADPRIPLSINWASA